MSGHSRWSQIKHKKAATDVKKGQAFSKLGKAISVAAKRGTDSSTNVTLKSLIEQARAANMPNDSIERAIKRAGEKDAAQLTEFKLEILASGNIALIVIGITDNTNRTLNELRTIAVRHGAKVVNPGSLSWMFDKERKPQYTVPVTNQEAFQALWDALDDHEDVQDIYSNAEE